jgi:hypothetical protein
MGNDIAVALKKLQPYDLDPFKPSLQFCISINETVAVSEDEQYKTEFKTEHNGKH